MANFVYGCKTHHTTYPFFQDLCLCCNVGFVSSGHAMQEELSRDACWQIYSSKHRFSTFMYVVLTRSNAPVDRARAMTLVER